jgi:hypothetical protein
MTSITQHRHPDAFPVPVLLSHLMKTLLNFSYDYSDLFIILNYMFTF